MTELYNFMKANGIYDLETLESRVDALHATLDELKAAMDSKSKQMKELQKLPDYLAAYKQLQPVADGLKKIKFDKVKEKYKAEHADDLKRFYEARRKITAKFPDGIYDSRVLDEEYAKLEQEYDAAYEQFKAVRSDSQTLWKIKSHVDTARQNMERKQEQTNRKRQEQEL